VPHVNAVAVGDPLTISPSMIYHLKLDSLAYISAAEGVVYLQPLLRNPRRKLPNSVKLLCS